MAAAGKPNPEAEHDEMVAEDDAVIGRVFKRSLWVIAVLAALVGLGWWLQSRPEAAVPETVIAKEAPQTVVREAVAPNVRFAEVSARAGIDFVHTTGAEGDKLLPETMGGGVAFFDYDNDGDQDLFFTNGTTWPWSKKGAAATPRLYANNGKGQFSDVTRAAGLAMSLYGMGVAAADFDGDGWRDLFLTAVGTNRLLRNKGGVFTDVTQKAGVAGAKDQWTTGASFFDVDKDGDLDLFVANYVRWSKDIDFEQDYRLTGVGRAYGPPQNYLGSHSFLYRNNGDGTFSDVSKAAGIEIGNPATGKPMGKALGIAPIDVDSDGAMDLLVGNDTVQKFFFKNKGDGSFEEVGLPYGVAYDRDGNATGSMGVDAGYLKNDADLAFLIGNFANEMTSVYLSQGDPTFYVDEAIGTGIGAPSRRVLSFGLFLFDYDLDGRLDMAQTNGHLEEEINKVDPSQQYRQAAQLFWNTGNEGAQTFLQVPDATVGDFSQPIVGRGSAYADIDGDGDLDVVLAEVGGKPLVLKNEQALGHHWLRVSLEGKSPNKDAIGSWVEATAGGITQRRQVMPTKSYLSQSELPITFGLGQATKVDKLVVKWPDGSTQEVPEAGIDRLETVRQGG